MNFKAFMAGLLAGLCLFIKTDANAANNLPKDAPKDRKSVV